MFKEYVFGEAEKTIDLREISKNLKQIANHFNNHVMFSPPVNFVGRFFEYKLDETMTVTANLMTGGEVFVYSTYQRSDKTLTTTEIGTLSTGLVIQDPLLTWPEVAQYAFWHKDWPECLAALNKAHEVATVMLT